ncbi:MAG: cache domain-containing protein, partial [Oscillospiraceae bacterium]
MRSIKTKMMVVVCLIVAISLLAVGGTVSVLMYTSSISSLEKTMSETAVVAADLVCEYLETYKTVANEAGLVARLSNSEISRADKKGIIDAKVAQYGFLAGDITDASGRGAFSDINVSDQDYFKTAMQGTACISNVLLSKSLNQYVVIVAAPLWDLGKINTKVVGIVYFNVDVKGLSNITNQIKVGNTGSAYMLDKDNYTIAHSNLKLVQERDNTREGVKTDSQLKSLSKLEAKMTSGEAGFGIYKYGGTSKILAYAPVDMGQGWSIAVNAELNEFLQSTIMAIIVTLVLVVISIIIGILISIKLANSITKPIVLIENAAAEMAKGNFDVDVKYESRDEIGGLANSMRKMIMSTKSIILDTARGLNEIASGNFDIAPTAEFIGVYEGIEKAISKIAVDLSDTMLQIKMATDQVASGSDQVSSGAQALAQGATEQASS